MTTEEALLAAVWASPHDDLPRLVYADWLDESGDPAKAARAGFIRVQCELAKPDLAEDHRGRLERKERDLWQRHRREFKRGLPSRLSDKPFHRGFVSPPLLEVSGHELEHLYWPILSAAPVWRFAVHAITEGNLSSLIREPAFLRLIELRVSWGGQAFRALMASHQRYNLTDLAWSSSFVGEQGVRWLAGCSLPHLQTLALPSTNIGDDGVAILANSELADRLVRLNLASNDIGPTGVGAMATGRFACLRYLDLSYVRSGDDAVEQFARFGSWPALKELRVFGADLTVRTAEIIASWPGAASLEHLDLSGNVKIGRAGAVALTQTPHLTELKSLRLSPNGRDYAYVVDVLRERFGFDNVVTHATNPYVVGGRRE